jgi:replicative DNA helicase
VVVQKSKDTIISTGYKTPDEILPGGFHKGEVVIIGGCPSIGKTAFALSLVRNITINNSISTGFVSLEMSKDALCKRLFEQNTNFTQNLDAIPLHIIDTPNMVMEELTNTIKDMVRGRQTELVFIDYLGLLHESNKNDAIKKIKSLALDLGIVIVVLSQFTRNSEGKPPNLKFFTGLSHFENDVDVVMALPRDTAEGVKKETRLFIPKNRDGERVGNVNLYFIPKSSIFEEQNL